MSLIINGMSLPKHSAVNGEKDTAYRCVVLAHPDNTVELVIDTDFASPYDNGHNIQRYPLSELPTPHGRLIDADAHIKLLKENHCGERCRRNHDCFTCGIDMYIRIVENEATIIEAEGVNE